MKTLNFNIRNIKNNLVVFSLTIYSLFFFASCQKENVITPSKESIAMSERQIEPAGNDIIQCHAADVALSQSVATKSYLILKIDHRAAMSFTPDYSVSLFSDGRVVYDGRRNVFFIGNKELKTSSDNIQVIKNLFTRSGFFAMTEDIPNMIDLPLVYTTYSEQGPAGDAQKMLRDVDSGYPLPLYSLRVKAESMLNISWLINGHDSSESSDVLAN
jgi:hypothetical protein